MSHGTAHRQELVLWYHCHTVCSGHQHTSSSTPLPIQAASRFVPSLAGCESEVEDQQLLSLANMLQARALQSRPNARHRYSLSSAQLQSVHPNPNPSGSPISDRAAGPLGVGQAVGQGSISPSMSHHATDSHSNSQHIPSTLSAYHVDQPQPGLPMMLKQQHKTLLEKSQDTHAAGLAAHCSAHCSRPHQACHVVDHSSGSYLDPSNKAGGQSSHPSWGREVHPGPAKGANLPRSFCPSVSCLSPFCRPQITALPVLPGNSSKVRLLLHLSICPLCLPFVRLQLLLVSCWMTNFEEVQSCPSLEMSIYSC